MAVSIRQFLAVALSVPVLAAAVEELPRPGSPSRLSKLAAHVAEQGPSVQTDFAAIALDAVIDAYQQELDVIQSSARRFSAGERARQYRWARAAQVLLEQLDEARYAIDLGAAAEVVASGPGEIQVLVGERMLPVASPRIGKPGALEMAVVTEFCELHACEQVLDEDLEQAAALSRGGWSFRQGFGSTYVTADGLGFMFASVRDRSKKEALCQRAAAELRDVASVLIRARELGIQINWPGLRVTRERVGQRLLVGFDGQGSKVSMPVLLRAPGVLQVAEPWLRARVARRSAQQLFPRADLLFEELLKSSG